MSLAYLGSGLVLLLVPGSTKVIGPEYIKVLSVSLIIYGIFRGFRAFSGFMNSKF